MAKKSVIARQVVREALVKRYKEKRKALKAEIKNKKISHEKRQLAMQKLAALPKDSNRCLVTGRPRGVFRRFKLCRHKIREFAALGQITGLLKSSW
jgi:small subunit ribosomal protein S14